MIFFILSEAPSNATFGTLEGKIPNAGVIVPMVALRTKPLFPRDLSLKPICSPNIMIIGTSNATRADAEGTKKEIKNEAKKIP